MLELRESGFRARLPVAVQECTLRESTVWWQCLAIFSWQILALSEERMDFDGPRFVCCSEPAVIGMQFLHGVLPSIEVSEGAGSCVEFEDYLLDAGMGEITLLKWD